MTDRTCAVGDIIEVTLLVIDSMSGPGVYDVAFVHPEAARMAVRRLSGEWINYKTRLGQGEVISGSRCVANGKVFDLETLPATEALRQQAISKLNRDEMVALGLDPGALGTKEEDL